MAKANYTKVEEALDEGLRKMTMQQLHALADGKTDEAKESQGKLIATLKLDLRLIAKTDAALFAKLEIDKIQTKKLLENPSTLTPEDWKGLIQLKERIDVWKKEFTALQTNDQLIEKERVKHINKRFNTNEKWLPLH